MSSQDDKRAQTARWMRREPLQKLLGKMCRGKLDHHDAQQLRTMVESELKDADSAHQRRAAEKARADRISAQPAYEVLTVVDEWVREYHRVGGIDASDLAWRLEEAGYRLPSSPDYPEIAPPPSRQDVRNEEVRQQFQCAVAWNEQHPVGTHVTVYPSASGMWPLATRTLSKAWLHGTEPVVRVAGYKTPFTLDQVQPTTVQEAARCGIPGIPRQQTDPEST